MSEPQRSGPRADECRLSRAFGPQAVIDGENRDAGGARVP